MFSRLKKDFYGLKKAFRAWYSKLDNYLLKCGFKRGATENNLYVKEKDRKLIVVVVYVDDIILSSDSDLLTNEFSVDMKPEFEISMLGVISYVLGLQIVHTPKGIFISQNKYLKEVLNIFGMKECSLVSTPMVIGWKLRKMDESPIMD